MARPQLTVLQGGRRLTPTAPVGVVKGVGPEYEKRLGRLGIATVRDLLLNLPWRWEPYVRIELLSQLQPGEQATFVGTVKSIRAENSRYKRLKMAKAEIKDAAGATLNVVWFNQSKLAYRYKPGMRIALAGKVVRGYGGSFEMRNPHHDLVSGAPSKVGELMPKYHETAGVASSRIADWVQAALPAADELEDTLPEDVRHRHRLLPIAEAVRQGHQPDSEAGWKEAKRRLAFAELFEFQAAFVLLRRGLEQETATPIPYRQEVIDAFKAGLPFELTNAQRKATWDVFKDLERELPMNRLLNGDVGSGKTAVAAAAAAMAHAAGFQTVVMAPTEILARQHLHKFRDYLEGSFPGLTVELLVSGLPAAERRRVRTAAASGHCALLVGTHALIEEDVELANLGLAVVDEQHRFGVRQRELLRAKGQGRPHFLAMTATPIPRTLALALYGEMAVSVLNELPPGRTPVATQVVEPEGRELAYELVRREVAGGRQAFVICPLVEESEKLQSKAATVEFERLRTEVFPDLSLALVHGKLREKDTVMAGFAAGETQVLVATAVVEVGVDVPNATVMLIEGANRFGLAQLHQFRGRVGRSAHQSYCLLLADEPTEEAMTRLRLVEKEHDGFRLAEADMRMRGVGELMGARQHGLTDRGMEALAHPELLSEAREEAESVLAADPDLEEHPALREAVSRRLELAAIS
ncbi:MAG TPA: ATP-dependent DNA helicase RecG [Candidatus Dormibacteraeota bacterium]